MGVVSMGVPNLGFLTECLPGVHVRLWSERAREESWEGAGNAFREVTFLYFFPLVG